MRKVELYEIKEHNGKFYKTLVIGEVKVIGKYYVLTDGREYTKSLKPRRTSNKSVRNQDKLYRNGVDQTEAYNLARGK